MFFFVRMDFHWKLIFRQNKNITYRIKVHEAVLIELTFLFLRNEKQISRLGLSSQTIMQTFIVAKYNQFEHLDCR